MGEHAKLSPSSAKRWMTCAVAPRREANLPDSSSPAAEWGTACHSILEKALISGERPNAQMANEFWYPLEEAVQKIGDLMEMVTTAAVAFDYVGERRNERNPADVRAETRVDPGSMIGSPDCWGTADTIIVSHNILEVIDLKSGQGVQIEADDPQLTLYAIGALAQYGGRSAPFEEIVCTIVQPRGFHAQGPIRSVKYTVDQLMSWCERDFARAVSAASVDNAVATPSEDGCRWCKAKSSCMELSQKSLDAVQGVFGKIEQPQAGKAVAAVSTGREDLAGKLTREPHELAPDDIRYILDNEKLITGWLSAVRKYAQEQSLAGNTIPGYKMVAGKGSRDWNKDEDIIKKTTNLKGSDGKRLGKTAMLEVPKVMSPAQAEKRIKPVVPEKTWEKISALIVKSAGAATLAPETDSRPRLITTADQMFDPIEPTTEPTAELADLSFLD